MITGTPINNSFLDLQHLIELFTQEKEDYFKDAPLGIHSLKGHFRKMEKSLEDSVHSSIVSNNTEQSDNIFKADALVNELVVQRSRAYVRKSLSVSESSNVLFPNRLPPTVGKYSLRQSYGKLIDHFVESFDRKDKETGRPTPILALPVYSPYEEEYFIGEKSKVDEMKIGRQTQIVNLIRQLLLKRFESSIAAFEETCIRIFMRLIFFLRDYKQYGNAREIDKFFTRRERIINYAETY